MVGLLLMSSLRTLRDLQRYCSTRLALGRTSRHLGQPTLTSFCLLAAEGAAHLETEPQELNLLSEPKQPWEEVLELTRQQEAEPQPLELFPLELFDLSPTRLETLDTRQRTQQEETAEITASDLGAGKLHTRTRVAVDSPTRVAVELAGEHQQHQQSAAAAVALVGVTRSFFPTHQHRAMRGLLAAAALGTAAAARYIQQLPEPTALSQSSSTSEPSEHSSRTLFPLEHKAARMSSPHPSTVTLLL